MMETKIWLTRNKSWQTLIDITIRTTTNFIIEMIIITNEFNQEVLRDLTVLLIGTMLLCPQETILVIFQIQAPLMLIKVQIFWISTILGQAWKFRMMYNCCNTIWECNKVTIHLTSNEVDHQATIADWVERPLLEAKKKKECQCKTLINILVW